MKAIIVAAGRGRRMRHFTKDTPKCLLQVNGKPLLYYQVNALRNNGIRQIVIVIGYRQKQIIDYCRKNFLDCAFTFVFNPFYETTNSLVSMWFARAFLKAGFVYLHSDILFDPKILSNILKDKRSIVMAVEGKHCDREDLRITMHKGTLRQINKRIPLSRADGEFIGIAKFSKKAAALLPDLLEQYVLQKKFSYWFELSWETLIQQSPIFISLINDFRWIEIDTPQDYLKARKFFQ